MLHEFILASSSPRRQQLLGYLIESFKVKPADIDETPMANEKAEYLVERLAKSKAQHIAAHYPQAVVLGSDTIISIEGEILGKPKSFEDFTRMMRVLSNNTHQVFTGVCLCSESSVQSIVVTTDVTMATISEEDILAYWQTKEPIDKAGGYAIQGIGGQFVRSIQGSFSAVVGLPLHETKLLINAIR